MKKFFDFSGLKSIGGFDVKTMSRIGVVAALYVVLTIYIAPIAYGPIQFRISEVLMLLCFLNPQYIISMIIGCATANLLASPYGMADVLLGTIATGIAAVLMAGCKNIWVSSIFPIITNALIIGFMLFFLYNEPLALSILAVGFGQFVVITVAGVPLFRYLFMRYPVFMRIIGGRGQLTMYN
ncbi:MAG: QueT transporter family protein [Oscillospiraceae bacterium]|nr:QueT transporter family protein [Oscillospiraceae bacterium]